MREAGNAKSVVENNGNAEPTHKSGACMRPSTKTARKIYGWLTVEKIEDFPPY
jgi:hypothetical protein